MSQLTSEHGQANDGSERIVAVAGATGLQGGAVTRRLLQDGWHVRALTRNPARKNARSVAALGADVVRADLDDPGSLERAFDGVSGVFSVQNHHISGYDGELTQGRHVTDAALRMGVRHVVYAAAGIGRPDTGIGSWDVKERIAGYMRDRNLPVTILRPMAFMELMTASKFFPAASTWHVMPKLMGAGRPVGWLAAGRLARSSGSHVSGRRDRWPDHESIVSGIVVEAGELEVVSVEVDDVGWRRDGDFVTVAADGPGGSVQTSGVGRAAGLVVHIYRALTAAAT